MRRAFPDALTTVSATATDRLHVGAHPGDHHVASSAIAASADLIVTINLKHFPRRILTTQTRVSSPGAFITELEHLEPSITLHAVRQLANRWTNPPRSPAEILDLLAAHPTMRTPISRLRPR